MNRSAPAGSESCDGSSTAPAPDDVGVDSEPPRGPIGNACAECPICCSTLAVEGQPTWNWPCPCRLPLHLNCAVQLRLTHRTPACPQCRSAWPGIVADNQFEHACRSNEVAVERNWQAGPLRGCPSEELSMPAEPCDLVLLCCERFIALGIPANSRRMTWASQQVCEPDNRGCRRHVGWIGDWVCNSCGRTCGQDNAVLQRLRASHSCGISILSRAFTVGCVVHQAPCP